MFSQSKKLTGNIDFHGIASHWICKENVPLTDANIDFVCNVVIFSGMFGELIGPFGMRNIRFEFLIYEAREKTYMNVNVSPNDRPTGRSPALRITKYAATRTSITYLFFMVVDQPFLSQSE